MGLGFGRRFDEMPGRLAGLAQRVLEIASHDFEPAHVEPELREPSPLVALGAPDIAA